jgi:hypothetical protein
MEGHMNSPTFDVFRGSLEYGALWIESIEGLGAATQRMFQLSVLRPGTYFVFDCENHKVVASTDTSPTPKGKPLKCLESKKKPAIDNVA